MIDEIEQLAIRLYADDGMALAIYSPEESWSRDREDIRERYLAKARATISRDPDNATIG